MSELDETSTVSDEASDAPQDDVVRGDDDMTDDERRLAKQRARDEEQREVDRAGDAERARQERANGEPEGARGRNGGPDPDQKPDPGTGESSPEVAHATPKRGSARNNSTGK